MKVQIGILLKAFSVVPNNTTYVNVSDQCQNQLVIKNFILRFQYSIVSNIVPRIFILNFQATHCIPHWNQKRTGWSYV